MTANKIRRSLRTAPHPQTQGRASCLPRLRAQRLRQAVREVLHVSAQRSLNNNLSDFGLKKGLDHLAAARERLLAVTDRFAAFQAQWLNVHVEFPLLQRLALPIALGTVRYPGIRIHDTRMIRLMEVLVHNGTLVSGWRARQIHQVVLTTFHIGEDRYRLNQFRCELRKMKAHGLLARDARRCA